ncbi:hypothetical protein COV11_03635 [Candidatus Woesearchaeota archaeon CG10_big_fil_rev_8_21_14_0_10_30_7]|nr:MAG: hypothetical protein COV11_03635 [Candidatus Woesearchaeota archaeon CG10_big_fil_rev_8_21_14_0_10_30_7]
MNKKVLDVPKIKQLPGNFCGVASLSMILSYNGIKMPQEELADYFESSLEEITHQGVYYTEVMHAARELGFIAHPYHNLTLDHLIKFIDDDFPIIIRCKAHWNTSGRHFYVVKGYDKNNKKIIINDPAHLNKKQFDFEELKKLWVIKGIQSTKNYGLRIRV